MANFVPLSEQQEADEATESKPTTQKVISLLNEAQLEQRQKKMDCLYQLFVFEEEDNE
ncbi:hypothetical protein GBAR_LOCUS25267, partial [Geodia barretti]